ncbi:MAG: zinc-ribbon domain-containing protein [Terriglobia bacterium]
MRICPKCHEDVPEGMRFCLQCGASLTVTAPPATPPREAGCFDAADPVAPLEPPAAPAGPDPVTILPRPRRPAPTITLKIAPTPVMTPPSGAANGNARPRFRDRMLEIDDEAFEGSFVPPAAQAGAVLCRFCRGPLDLAGDYCEQCGAPVAEAAPPGALKPRPQPAVPPASDPAPAAPPPQAESAANPEPTPNPAPPALTSSPTPPGEENAPGFMNRLKGVFKRG